MALKARLYPKILNEGHYQERFSRGSIVSLGMKLFREDLTQFVSGWCQSPFFGSVD